MIKKHEAKHIFKYTQFPFVQLKKKIYFLMEGK